ncbi:MAG: hypothetical protein AAGJ82_11605 [Bacteroidota bacterium]
MPTFRESDLTFHFPRHWYVRRYDQQPFYLRMSGLGLKGVDFVALDPLGTGHLYLIEVKNYRTRQTASGTYLAHDVSPEELAQATAVKFEHTQRAIRAVQLHYRRQWWYRLAHRYWQTSKRYQQTTVFWTKAFQCLQDAALHTHVLWLETEEPNSEFEKTVRQVISYELETGSSFAITNTEREALPGLVVTR